MAQHAGKGTDPLRPSWLRARLAKWAVLPYRSGLGFLLARQVMILTTRGRKTGKARRTPLWYIREEDTIYCLSGWGSSSDWLKNLRADPYVTIQIGGEEWETEGKLREEPQEKGRVLRTMQEKYGRRTVGLFYHLDRLVLVAFPLTRQRTTKG
jgi:deazaflavin-dependent oxidoreductase (nitroreductase family)